MDELKEKCLSLALQAHSRDIRTHSSVVVETAIRFEEYLSGKNAKSS